MENDDHFFIFVGVTSCKILISADETEKSTAGFPFFFLFF